MAQHKAQRHAAPGRNQTPTVDRAKFQSPGHYTAADREKIKHFAGSDGTYPISVPQDIEDAAGLYGNAKKDSPETVKANIIRIAKELGPAFVAKLPDAWKEEESRASMPEVARLDDSVVRIATPSDIRIIDEDKWIIEVCATSEAVDTFGTVFDYEASKDAFRRWIKTAGNIREMHQPIAVGHAVGLREDDEARKIYTRLQVSKGAPHTWEKVKDNTLGGSSLGASNVRWVERRMGDKNRRVAERYDLVELSLVDNASNPDAQGITFIRAAMPDMTILEFMEDDTTTESRAVEPAPSVAPPSPPKGRADVASLPPALAALYAEDTRVAPAPQSALEAVATMTVTPSETPATPAQTPHEPTTNEIMREMEAVYQAKLDRADRIAAAGDAAVAQLAPWDPTMDPNQYASAQASTRGRAEAAEIRRIQTESTQQQKADTTRTDAPMTMQLVPPSNDTHTGHVHEHAHSHRDGVIHNHPHAHSHDDHMTDRADAVHAEHEHATYRNQIWDVALLAAEIHRAPFGSQPGVGAWQTNTATKGSHSSVSTVQPQNVGSRTLYNTEDVNALEFGVPAAVTPSATPTGDITLNPAEFHAGGHTSTPDLAANSEKVLTDTTPREKSVPLPAPETVASTAEPMPELRPGFGGNADFIPGGHPEQFDPASGAYDKDGDYDEGEDIAEAEHGAKVIGTGTPKATVVPKAVGEPTPMRADVAEEERYSKTISAASAESLHGIMRDAANLCKCPACVIFVSGGHEEPDGDEDMEDEEGDMGEEDDEDRVALADTQRQTSLVLSQLTQVVQDLSAHVTQIASSHKDIASQIANITASQSDQQRMMTAQVTRALHDQQQAIDGRLALTQQHLERLASLGLETKKVIDVIAMQPVAPLSGPAMYAHDKRIALSGDTGQSRGIDAEDLAELARGTSPQTQTELAAALIRRAGPTSIPAPRQRIG